jgi:hypothetical protein
VNKEGPQPPPLNWLGDYGSWASAPRHPGRAHDRRRNRKAARRFPILPIAEVFDELVVGLDEDPGLLANA